jgi:hypothetical protein
MVSLVHTNKASEKAAEYDYGVICDTLQENCIKRIYAATAGDLNAGTRPNLAGDAVDSEDTEHTD